MSWQDHKPNREDERQRIEALGGTVDLHGVWRVICPEQVVFGGEAAEAPDFKRRIHWTHHRNVGFLILKSD